MTPAGPQPLRRPPIDFKASEIDAFLISGSHNVRYVTGFTGSNGLLLLQSGSAMFFTDPRYDIQSTREVSCPITVVKRGALMPAALKFITRRRLKSIGFEKTHLTYQQYALAQEKLTGGARLKPMDDVVLNQRMVKTDEEIATIRQSVETNSKAYDGALTLVKAGMSESDLAAEIEYQMRKLGAERPAFETIVAAGARTAMPHARPTSRPIGANELVLIDMGSSQGGYASDMTRMLHLGAPNRKTKAMYRAVLEAQLAAIDAVRPGVSAAKVDAAARNVLKKHDLDETFTHSTGHGLGLEIHEPPRLGKGDKTRLLTGMAITIEPGAYVADFGGIRIEDTVVVTKNGCDILTPTSKELIAL